MEGVIEKWREISKERWEGWWRETEKKSRDKWLKIHYKEPWIDEKSIHSNIYIYLDEIDSSLLHLIESKNDFNIFAVESVFIIHRYIQLTSVKAKQNQLKFNKIHDFSHKWKSDPYYLNLNWFIIRIRISHRLTI